MNEYLTIDELSARIKFSRQSIYNLIYKKVLVQQVHFFKPTPKKLLFSWTAIQDWIERECFASDVTSTAASTPPPTSESQLTGKTGSRINI